MSKKLLEFIIEARKRGFSDIQIKKALSEYGWPVNKIDKAFQSLMPKFKSKNQICIFLSDDILKVLEKRAKKNMHTLPEMIEDILRRSCLTYKGGTSKSESIDDTLVKIFSKQKRKSKKK